jgi:hypothetical protein
MVDSWKRVALVVLGKSAEAQVGDWWLGMHPDPSLICLH